MFFKKSFSHKTILMTISMVVQRNILKNKLRKVKKKLIFPRKDLFTRNNPKDRISRFAQDSIKLNLKTQKTIDIFCFF